MTIAKDAKIVGVIPSRYASTRLPAKALADIGGKPMVQWVYENAKRARSLSEVVIATDDDRIAAAVEKFGGRAVMTSTEIQSGTDRVAAVADQIGDAEILVNIQGDEPLLQPENIDRAVTLVTDHGFEIGTIMTHLRSFTELDDPACVKVIADDRQRAIYFSRHPIPYSRGPRPARIEDSIAFRHLGLYVYRRDTLMRFRSLPASALEKAEVLEQLRAMQAGMSLGIARVPDFAMGVDTPEDLAKVRELLSSK